MEDLVALFKSSPLEAIGLALCGGVAYLWKNKQEKKADTESRGVDAREIDRLNKVVDLLAKERDDERERADAAFAKQLELTERFSEMRAQNERLLERMEQVSKQLAIVIDENTSVKEQLRDITARFDTVTSQYDALSHQFEQLQKTTSTGAQ